jgi:hypothetical protein
MRIPLVHLKVSKRRALAVKEVKQVRWSELRDNDKDGHPELFYVIAEQNADGWIFYERSCWELRWYEITPTERLLKKAVANFNRNLEQEQSSTPRIKQVA